MMPDHNFLFASLDSRKPNTARRVHIRRLYDIFQLSVQKQDYPRATRAWAILARCKEFDWMAMWMTGLLLLGSRASDAMPTKNLEYLKSMMLQNTGDRELILQELLFCLIRRGEYREAIIELELYLPAFPYQDNPVLHTYAALLSLYTAQPSADEENPAFDPILLRDAQSHLEHAKRLDPSNASIQAFLDKLTELQSRKATQSQSLVESEDDSDIAESEQDDEDELGTPRAKRKRI